MSAAPAIMRRMNSLPFIQVKNTHDSLMYPTSKHESLKADERGGQYAGHPDLSNDSSSQFCFCACSLTRTGFSMTEKKPMAHAQNGKRKDSFGKPNVLLTVHRNTSV
jgi:hypothetical protein